MASVLVEDEKEKQEKSNTLFDTLDDILNHAEASDCFRTFLVPLLSDNQLIFLECLHSLAIKYGKERVLGREALQSEDAPLVIALLAIFYKYIHKDAEKLLNFDAALHASAIIFDSLMSQSQISDKKSTAESVSLAINSYELRVKAYNANMSTLCTAVSSFKMSNLFGFLQEDISLQLRVNEKLGAFKNSDAFKQLTLRMTETHLPHIQWTAKPPNIANELHTLRFCMRECLEAIHHEKTRERKFSEKAREKWKQWTSKNKKDLMPEKLGALYTLITSGEAFNIRTFRQHLSDVHTFLTSASTDKTTTYVYLDTLEKIKPLRQAIIDTLDQIPIFQQALDLKAQSTAHIRHAAVSTPTNLSPPSSARTSASTPSPSPSPSPVLSPTTSTQPVPPSPAGSMRRASASALTYAAPKPLGPQHRHHSSRTLRGNVDIHALMNTSDGDKEIDKPERPSSATLS